MQKNVTRNGTLRSSIKPLNNETTRNSLPENLSITGSVVSIVVAPPTEIRASLPKYFTKKGANSRAITSRMILDRSAIVPSSAHLYSVIKILDND